MKWKDIPGYENLYKISDTTLVKGLSGKKSPKERIIKPYVGSGGYLYVRLYNNDRGQNYLLHRLMFESFISPCPKGLEICHNDGNPKNNLIENLRCDTHKNNQKDMVKHGRCNPNPVWLYKTGEESPGAKLNDWKIRVINRLLEDGYLTQKEIADIFGVVPQTISKIKNKERWKHVLIN